MISSIKDSFVQGKTSLLDIPEPGILNRILDAIYDPSKDNESNLKALGQLFVSRQLSERVIDVKNYWINEKGMNLKLFGCLTAKEAVEYIIKHQLTNANLSAFHAFNVDHLEELSLNAPQLKMLSLGALNKQVNGLRPCTKSHEDFGKQLVESLARFTRLRGIEIDSCNRITNEVLKDMTGKELEHLSLKNCSGFNRIGLTPALRCLDLSGTRIKCGELSDPLDELAEKGTPSMIEILDLSDCKDLSCEWLQDILAQLPHLRSLTLSGCNQLFGDDLAKALRKCPKLEILDLSGCEGISGSELADFPLLYSLNLSSCFKLKEIPELYPLLRNLSISYCTKLSGDQLDKFTNLECLNIRGCSQISYDQLAALRNLCSLNISDCDQISDDLLKKIALAFPMLKHLVRYMYNGVNISPDRLVESLRSFKALENFNNSMDLKAYNFSFSTGEVNLPMLYTYRCIDGPSSYQVTDFSLDRKKRLPR